MKWFCLLACLPLVLSGAPLPIETCSLVKNLSGHIAVLPAPGLASLQSSLAGRTLSEAGLEPHLAQLRPQQFADTNFFTGRRFPLALYLGFESYFQTVTQPGDGDRALRNYLAGGGALLVLPTGPYPLYYNEASQPANGASQVGLQIGAGSFEKPPPQLRFSFHSSTHSPNLGWPPSPFPFPTAPLTDQRWRPSRSPDSAEVRYVPLVTLLDENGGNHGEGAALLEYTQGPMRGGRVLYIWNSLLAEETTRAAVMDRLLQWALEKLAPPSANQLRDDFEGRESVTDDWAYWSLHSGQWQLDQGNLVGRGCVADSCEIKGAARGNSSWTDYTMSVRFKIEQRGSDWRDGPWFGLRVRPDGDGYYLGFTDRDCQLHKVIYGIHTRENNVLAKVPWKSDQEWHALQVHVTANRFEVTLNGQPFLKAEDDAHLDLPSMRRGGFVLAARKSSRSQGETVVRFDDVQIELMKD